MEKLQPLFWRERHCRMNVQPFSSASNKACKLPVNHCGRSREPDEVTRNSTNIDLRRDHSTCTLGARPSPMRLGEAAAPAAPGSRVVVQFGPRKILTGIILHLKEEDDSGVSMKEILDVLDDQPVVNEKQLQFFQWMTDYYLCTPGDVMSAALPSALKLSSKTYVSHNPEAGMGRRISGAERAGTHGCLERHRTVCF